MERLALLFASATIAACSAASEPKSHPLSCVPDDSCGCRILVAVNSCPDGGAHFFHELRDGSPLIFNLGHGDISAASTRAPIGMFTPAPGESWVETYRYSGGHIELHYSPAARTCTKSAPDDDCEFFDVRAKVVLVAPSGPTSYSGVGACGC